MFRSDAYLRRITTFAIWTLPIITFTIPTRLEPSSFASLDGLALLKLLLLMIVMLGGAIGIASRVQDRGFRATLAPLLPFYLFFGWAVFSVFWTPRLAITVGQAGALAGLLVLASLIGVTTTESEKTERVIRTLSRMLATFSAFVIAVHIFFPEFSGLDRRMLGGGSEGVVHPTAAGASASLGLLVSVLCFFVTKYSWATRGAVIGCLLHGTVLIYASSRMALVMAAVTIALVFMIYAGNLLRAATISSIGLLLVLSVMVDPAFEMIFDSDSTAVQYITRGQSTKQLEQVSGREEMWAKVFNEFTKSKLVGHGYFITSEAGEIEVWDMKANHTAHNIYLQVLVSTGLIGLAIFLAAFMNLFRKFGRLAVADQDARAIASILAFIAIWYLGWSTLCVSFMGPIRSESVVFFVFIGIGLGQLRRIEGRSVVTPNSRYDQGVLPQVVS